MATNSISTMEEFAESVGLSRQTVSRFFGNPSSVRATTRKRIETAMEKSGYRPNLLAVNRDRAKSQILGLVVPSLFDPFYMALARGIDQIATARGFQAFTLSSDGKPELELEAIQTFTSMNVAGTLIAPLGRRTKLSKLRQTKKDMPLVALDSALDDETSFVGTNNAQSVNLIVDYLCRSGEPPVYFDMPAVNDNAFQRRKTYRDSMEGLFMEPTYAFTGDHETWDFEKFAFEKTSSLIQRGEFEFKTVLCANDRLAFGVIAACNKHGLKVGRTTDCDLRVAGHDDQPLSAYYCPPLTTVSQNYEHIARTSMEVLFSKIDETDPPDVMVGNQVLLDAELKLRDSA